MEKLNDITKLIEEIERISEIEKCLTCQCFYDTLMEFKEVLEKEKPGGDLNERLSRLIEKSKVTHDCLGCDPCYPVPVSNALHEIMGAEKECSCGPVCKPAPIKLTIKTPSWPVEQGEYIIGNQASPVAISTLGSDELPEVISKELGIAIVGKTHTENIGIEKIVKNTITNPYIRFLIICGKDTRGHMAGQSLLSLFSEGVNQEKRITGSKGQRPVLKNLEFSEIEHFRKQAEVIDLSGLEDIKRIKGEVNLCKKKNPGRFDKALAIKRVPQIEASRPEKLILDPSGFFIIYPRKDEGNIYLEHYRADGTLNEIICGEDPVFITSTAIARGLVSKLDHTAYLGRELEKAYLSMIYGFQYIQDSPQGKEQKEDELH
jgi:tetrahydromethanopterin S-methyltransferase subunit A